jgi:phosphoribosyl-ATP pyrophosphohydrolase
VNEAADLFYHYTVLLAVKGIKIEEVEKILRSRHNEKSISDSR